MLPDGLSHCRARDLRNLKRAHFHTGGGRSTESLKELWIGPANGFEGALLAGEGSSTDFVEAWKRVRLAPGIELFLEDLAPKPDVTRLRVVMEAAERHIRSHFR